MSPASPGPAAEWRPGASREALEARAAMLRAARAFFAERGVLEVDTPLLGSGMATEPHLASLSTTVHAGRAGVRRLYLQTSPEFAMKRLLAAGSGPIYQICKAFRDGEAGRLHNPEFTLVEWYRPGFEPAALMDEVEALVTALAGTGPAVRLSYRDALRIHAGIDPFEASLDALRTQARACGLGAEEACTLDRAACLDLLMSVCVQARLGAGCVLVHGFPAGQSAMARPEPEDPRVAQRFELFVGGVEIANGYGELGDSNAQRRAFEADLARRAALGLDVPPVDERVLAAIAAGLPPCSGVALGLDRLLMHVLGADSLDEVLAFSLERA